MGVEDSCTSEDGRPAAMAICSSNVCSPAASVSASLASGPVRVAQGIGDVQASGLPEILHCLGDLDGDGREEFGLSDEFRPPPAQ